ncbi:LL-diaminopimelate aminotransferase [Candidatus Oleimmundimicrobium sp.]|uniref:LL-diaminopimelate aminotransferase n=1 Tax=Candidatus Oleimmundimicrobium sp. TaxID=3060597 RepID=UPI0027292024|nr:LL-diaminopimelate aminotransferase [Candidatus Oleimmundimicrobium sp.]MDO8885405.1 LL-diaminopimelate aminotransferase [Candidatus Oleimmundimicrobium sp.]
MKQAQRIKNLPPYLFAEIDKKIAQKRAEGVDVISLGIGDPVEPTPSHIIDMLCEQARNPENHRYPSYFGMPGFREAIANFCKNRFNLNFEADSEILPLIGSKEGIAHIFLAFIDPGDIALIPDPGYPVYKVGTILAGGKPYYMPLLSKNNYLPDLTKINKEVARRAKIMFINYPNNPTSATASLEFFEEVVAFAKKYDILVCHDNAYSEIAYDGYVPSSFLEVPGAKNVGIEFQSLSKTYNMTGWRIGFAIGNKMGIEALGRVKTNVDSGIFNAIQYAGIAALEGSQDCVKQICSLYAKRRNMVVEALRKMNLGFTVPKATIYVWVRVPDKYTSASFATHILESAGVVISPGNAYGPSGEGYVRISLSVKDDRLIEALKRIENSL